jgi:ATP/maltotriose-dependent transcriptional regulator MalT
MALVAQGFSNRDIAEALVLSELTVKTHLKHIFKKLDVRSRQEAVAVAARRMAGG